MTSILTWMTSILRPKIGEIDDAQALIRYKPVTEISWHF